METYVNQSNTATFVNQSHTVTSVNQNNEVISKENLDVYVNPSIPFVD